MEQKGANREVVYQEFKDLQWRIDVPLASMYDKQSGAPEYNVRLAYNEGAEDKHRWLTLSHEQAAALLQDVQAARFSMTAPHAKRIGRIVK